jgi:hypothetical protein
VRCPKLDPLAFYTHNFSSIMKRVIGNGSISGKFTQLLALDVTRKDSQTGKGVLNWSREAK